MGLIKASSSAISSTFGDQFKEYVECPQVSNDVIIQRGVVKHGEGNENYSESIISNGSTIVVPQGMAMMIVDNGKIVEFTAEAGTYKWDTSSEPSIFNGNLGKSILDSIKTLGNRITYGGQTAKDQRVYFVNIKIIPGNTFGSTQSEVVFDPVYGSVEITYNGEYAIKVDDPIILVNNVIGANPKDTLTFGDIFKTDGLNMLKSKFSQKVSEAISTIMTMHNISFNRIQSYKSDVTDQMNKILNDEWHSKYGIIVEDVTLRVNASEESKKIVQEMDAEIAKTTRMGQAYSNNMAGTMAAASAEAMKNAASNANGTMAGFMGMNLANMQGNNMMGTVSNMSSDATSTEATSQPEPGTLFKKEDDNVTSVEVKEETTVSNGKFCVNCGNPVNGNFCGNCGTKVE